MSRHYGPGYHHFRRRARWEFYHLLDEKEREAKRRKNSPSCSSCMLLESCPTPYSNTDHSKCFIRPGTKRRQLTDEDRERLKESRLLLEELQRKAQIENAVMRVLACCFLIGGIVASAIIESPVAFFVFLVLSGIMFCLAC